MKLKKGQKMPFRDAMAIADDSLPEGAYWAMAHEIAGLEYGEGFDELAIEEGKGGAVPAKPISRPFQCTMCERRFKAKGDLRQHRRSTGHSSMGQRYEKV